MQRRRDREKEAAGHGEAETQNAGQSELSSSCMTSNNDKDARGRPGDGGRSKLRNVLSTNLPLLGIKDWTGPSHGQ